MSTLGTNLGKTLRELIELYVTLPDGAQKKEVHDQVLKISDMIDKLVDEALPTRIKEYKDTTEALGKAIEDIEKAKADIAKVAKAIDSAAKAISAIAKLLAVLGIGA
jgi:hypothetical protein